MFAALMIGHHFSISALWNARRASGDPWPGGGMSWPRSANRLRTAGSANVSHHGRTDFDDDVLGRALRQPETMPKGNVKPRHRRLVDRGDVWSADPTAFGEDRIWLDLARAN